MAKKPTPAAAGHKQAFDVLGLIHHDGDVYDLGDKISVTEVEYDQLKTAGVIAGDWVDQAT